MRNLLDRLFKTGTPQDQVILEREAQNLRLELEESQRTITSLKAELERQRSSSDVMLAEKVSAQTEALLSDLAAPAAQLVTQAHLVEAENVDVSVQDILVVVRRLLRALEGFGLAQEGSIGTVVSFDPGRHEPLSAEAIPRPGDPVVVRFVGFSYQGRLLRKVGVQQVDRGAGS